jgi:hypothetical protein
MFEYCRAMRTTKSYLRYFDYCGNVLDAWGKTGGLQGDPLEMIAFCLSIHHLWGRTLNVALEVLSDINVFKEDAGLDLNFRKTKLFVKGISAADAHDAAAHACCRPLPRAPQSPALPRVLCS